MKQIAINDCVMKTDVSTAGKWDIANLSAGPSTKMIGLAENVFLDALSSKMSAKNRNSLVTASRRKVMAEIMKAKPRNDSTEKGQQCGR